MFRKFLIGYLLLLITCKAGSFTYLFATGSLNLPFSVLISSGGLLAIALMLLVKEYTHTTRRRDFSLFFLLDILLTLFNLFYTAMASPLRVSVAEMILIGSFTDIIVAVVFLAAVFRGRNYAIIRDYAQGESTPPQGDGPKGNHSDQQDEAEEEKPNSTV